MSRYGFAGSWLLRCRCIFFGRQPLYNIQKNFLVKESAPINNHIMRSHSKKGQSLLRLCLFGFRPGGLEQKSTTIWEYILYVLISLMMIIAICKFIFNLTPERTKSAKARKTAIESFEQYSQRLDAISKKYADELKSLKKVN
jgi:hypothetical protein